MKPKPRITLISRVPPRLVVADTSDHAIPAHQPDLIIDAIVDLLEGMN